LATCVEDEGERDKLLEEAVELNGNPLTAAMAKVTLLISQGKAK
jgi:hypothetical protein